MKTQSRIFLTLAILAALATVVSTSVGQETPVPTADTAATAVTTDTANTAVEVPGTEAIDTTILYSLSVVAGGGYARDISEFAPPSHGLEIKRNQFCFFGRLMWQPEHRLAGGLEIGYITLYSTHNQTGGKVVRSAYPCLLTLRMRIVGPVNLVGQFGVVPLTSNTSGNNQAVDVSSFSWGAGGGINVLIPAGRFAFGVEGRYLSIDHFDDQVVTVSGLIYYHLTEY